jgi:hypothetical protein
MTNAVVNTDASWERNALFHLFVLFVRRVALCFDDRVAKLANGID